MNSEANMKNRLTSLALGLALFLAFIGGCSGKQAPMPEVEPESKPVQISEFILGVGDSIEVTVYRHDDLKKTYKIDSSGRLMFPLIGDVEASGRSVFKLSDEIRDRLPRHIVNPQVTISVTAVQSQKIIVLGEVNNPGVQTLDSSLSAVDAISKAGGMTVDAKLSNVVLIRRVNGKGEVTTLDLDSVIKKGEWRHNRFLQSGDILYVPAFTIANVSWYFGHLSKILSPIVNLESGIVLWPQAQDVLLYGESASTTPLSIPAR